MFTCWTFERICQSKHLLQTSQLHFCACCNCLCVGAVLQFGEYRRFGAMSYCYLPPVYYRRASISQFWFGDCVTIFFYHTFSQMGVCVRFAAAATFHHQNLLFMSLVAYTCMLFVLVSCSYLRQNNCATTSCHLSSLLTYGDGYHKERPIISLTLMIHARLLQTTERITMIHTLMRWSKEPLCVQLIMWFADVCHLVFFSSEFSIPKRHTIHRTNTPRLRQWPLESATCCQCDSKRIAEFLFVHAILLRVKSTLCRPSAWISFVQNSIGLKKFVCLNSIANFTKLQ